MELPKSCNGGKIGHCWDCMWHAGACRHICPKRGGDGEFEPIRATTEGNAFNVPEFISYDIACNLSDDMFREEDFDHNGKVMITSRKEEREMLKRLPVHKAERGEKVMGITAELKDRPKKKIYSFTKG